MLNISELTVLVKVNIDNLNDFSKPILSTTNKLDKMNKLKKNEINIRKEVCFKIQKAIFINGQSIMFQHE